MTDKLNGCIFLIEDDDLLEKYITIQNKVSADIVDKLIVNLSISKNFLKTKINSLGDQVTYFYHKKIPKVESNHTCLAVIKLDSALKKIRVIIHKIFKRV